MKKLAAFFLVITLLSIPAFAQKTPPLRYLQSIPMPDLKAGDFDHFAIDLAGNRLFLTAEDNSLVEVFDLKANKLTHTIKDVDTPHSMLYLPESKQLWVVCGGDGALKIFNADTYVLTDTIKLPLGADSSVYDPAKHLLYIVTGGEDAKLEYSLISIVDTSTRKHVGDIKVGSGNIEALAFEKNGSKLFANVRDKKSVGVFDRDKKTQLATWPLGDLTGNTPMAFDDASRRLFVVGRKPANLVVLNADTGKIVATLPAAEMVDALFKTIGKSIKKEGRFAYPGFGTWTVRSRKARKGRNPQTGAEIKIKASKTVGFKPSKELRAMVANLDIADLEDEAEELSEA